jgi:hypothetical protein
LICAEIKLSVVELIEKLTSLISLLISVIWTLLIEKFRTIVVKSEA